MFAFRERRTEMGILLSGSEPEYDRMLGLLYSRNVKSLMRTLNYKKLCERIVIGNINASAGWRLHLAKFGSLPPLFTHLIQRNYNEELCDVSFAVI